MPTVQVAIGIVVREGETPRILVCQRPPKPPLPNYWEFPGGKVELGESADRAVVRELMEELGVRATVLEGLPLLHHAYPHATVEIHPFLCRIEDDAIPKALGCQQFRWVTTGELGQYQFPEANGSLLAELRARLTGQDGGTPYNAPRQDK